MDGIGRLVVRRGVGDIHRHDEDGDALPRQGRLAGRDGLAAGLFRREDHLAEDTAVSVHVDEVDLLDRFEAQIPAHNLACDQDDGGAVAIGLVKPVDEVEAAGAARACTGGEAARELGFGARGERSGFLMPHVDPFDFAAVDGVSDPVQRVADDPVAPLHTGSLQRFDQQVGYAFAHDGPSLPIGGPERRRTAMAIFERKESRAQRRELANNSLHAPGSF